eukprot:m.269521 g.269521  ORF g.269521 m.269521 type:complete len:358 (-) comp16070_c0_seq5:1810-2883(-)
MARVNDEYAEHGIAAAAILVAGLLGAALPLWLDSTGQVDLVFKDRLLHRGSVFGAGVFIGAGFIHLLPDAAATLDADPIFQGYPTASALASAGLLLTLLVEVAAVRSVLPADRGATPPELIQRVDSGPCYTRINDSYPSEPTTNNDAAAAPPLGGRTEHFRRKGSVSSVGAASVVSLVAAHQGERVERRTSALAGVSISDAVSPGTSRFAALAMFVALSFHSALAGVALGVEASALSSIFVAILAHKSIAAFSLGTSFVRARAAAPASLPRRTVVLWLLAFACVTPTGVMVGTALTEDDLDPRAAACLKAIAAGTFLHVGLIEIAAKEFGSGASDQLAKAVALLLGWGVMATIALWI